MYSIWECIETYALISTHWHQIFLHRWMDWILPHASGKDQHNHQHIWPFHKRSIKGTIPLTCWLPVGPYSTCIFTYLCIICGHVHKSTHWSKNICAYIVNNPHDGRCCKGLCPTIWKLCGQSLADFSLVWLVQSIMHLHIRLWGGVTVVCR